MSSLARVGFVGTGNMGGPMAINLAKKGYEVFAFDTMRENIQKLNNIQGLKTVGGLKEVAQQSDVIITMLPNHNIVKQVCEGESGLFQNAKKGCLIIDSSTILPQAVKDIAENGQKHGVQFVDAPVSGGVTGATNGTLTFMLGSNDKQLVDKCKPILQAMGKNIFECGQTGSGQIAKMCNNMALAIQMLSIAEATSLGVKSGMDPKLLYEVMRVSTARCWSVDTYNPVPGVLENVPASRDYQNGFACKLMLKDLNIAKDSSKLVNASTPLGEHVISIYEDLCKDGFADKDFGVIYQYLQNKK